MLILTRLAEWHHIHKIVLHHAKDTFPLASAIRMIEKINIQINVQGNIQVNV